jgi:hypothetical protein
MFKKIGKKMIQGAKAEIQEKPIQIFDTEAIEGLGEILIGVGMLTIAAVLLFRKPATQPIIYIVK